MGLVNRVLQLGFELFLALISVGLVLAVLIPVLRYLHLMPGYPWGAVLAGVLVVGAAALTTLRPGGSLRPRV